MERNGLGEGRGRLIGNLSTAAAAAYMHFSEEANCIMMNELVD
jgi:hypothetical protein